MSKSDHLLKIRDEIEDYLKESWNQTPKEKKKQLEELEEYKPQIDKYYKEKNELYKAREKREAPMRKMLKELEIENNI